MMRARRFVWITILLATGAAATEPEPGSAAIELGRLFTTPAERLRIESIDTQTPVPAGSPAPHENSDDPLTSAVFAALPVIPSPPAAPAAIPVSPTLPTVPPPHIHGRLHRDDHLLAEWPRKLPQHEVAVPGFRVGTRRVTITPTHQGGWLQCGLRRFAEWPQQVSAR